MIVFSKILPLDPSCGSSYTFRYIFKAVQKGSEAVFVFERKV